MKIENFPADSPIHVKLGTVIKFCVTSEGRLRIIKNPIPGIKLSVRPISNQAVVIVEDCEEEVYLLDVLQLGNAGSLDAKTREGLRSFREQTGILINPLFNIPSRTQLEVPEGVHCIFWAYYR